MLWNWSGLASAEECRPVVLAIPGCWYGQTQDVGFGHSQGQSVYPEEYKKLDVIKFTCKLTASER